MAWQNNAATPTGLARQLFQIRFLCSSVYLAALMFVVRQHFSGKLRVLAQPKELEIKIKVSMGYFKIDFKKVKIYGAWKKGLPPI